MSVTLANPIVITSGTLNTKIIDGNIKVDQLYWHLPTIGSTSNLIISKKTPAGMTYINMQCETSGESQVMSFDERWFRDPYCRCVPTGTLYIYTK